MYQPTKFSEGFEHIRKQTHFSKEECEKLIDIFRKLVAPSNTGFDYPRSSYSSGTEFSRVKSMERLLFKEILHDTFHIITEDILTDRIFNAFDKRNDGVIRIDEWILGLSVFLRGTLEERTFFSFFVYDLNSDGSITKDEIFALLKNSLLKIPQDEEPDETVKDLADLILKKLDCDRDGKISFLDYQKAVLKDNLLVEALGQCFPSYDVTQHFLASLAVK